MATKAELEWMGKVADFGCIVCFLYHNGIMTPCAVHHILGPTGRRSGHLYTIGLCDPGHHKMPQSGSGKIARHPNKAQFVKAYGEELYLLERLKSLIKRKEFLEDSILYKIQNQQ